MNSISKQTGKGGKAVNLKQWLAFTGFRAFQNMQGPLEKETIIKYQSDVVSDANKFKKWAAEGYSNNVRQ